MLRRRKPTNLAGYRRAVIDLALAEKPKIVCEVGVYQAGLSRMLAALPSVQKLHLVDPWPATYSGFGRAHMEDVAAGVYAWARGEPKVTVHRMRSTDAAPQFEDGSICFFQTDNGDHSFAGITSDIEAWYPKVKAGGILCGDNFEMPTVAAGVNKLLPDRQLGAKGRFWWARKPL